MGILNQISGVNQSGVERTVLVKHLTAGATIAPAVGDPAAPLITGGLNYQYNDTNWDPVVNNLEQTVLAAGTRSATVTSGDLTNLNNSGAVFFLDITSLPASGSTTVALIIQGKDFTSSRYVTLFTSAQISASGTTAVSFHPGVSSGSNSVPMVLPRTFRVLAAVSAGATSKDVVFSVGMSFVR
ncbi:MAG: hypothetical protein [Podoviridae sp. ctQNx1]|nr:MAG: hypothetical protein [Podoviridae sp. ctQNx1]UOF78147.1 hypothetical protein [Caudoviricetes sp.]